LAGDYYSTLGVKKDASAEEIKRAYRKKAMQVHPDVASDDPQAEEKFKAINEAYEVLSDPQKRSIFDRGGDPMRSGASGGFDPFAGFGGFNAAGGFDISDLMGAMFGGGAGRGPVSRVRRGKDQLARVQLRLVEAAFGTTKLLKLESFSLCQTCSGVGTADGSAPKTCTQCQGRGEVISVQRSFLGDIRQVSACPRCHGFGTIIANPCATCSGEGRVRAPHEVSVQIPAGVGDKNRIHLAGQGEVGPGGGPAGDLYVEVLVAAHETFKRDGDNLEMVVRLPMTAAALGTEVTLSTLEADDPERFSASEAETTLKVPSGTQSGARIAIKGKGVPRLRSASRGDLGVTVLVQTPSSLDDDQRSLLRQLAELRDETQPEVAVGEQATRGFFAKIKDALS
jgi:molecular chaperone DnaJ